MQTFGLTAAMWFMMTARFTRFPNFAVAQFPLLWIKPSIHYWTPGFS